MIFVLDVGNTNIMMGVYNGNKLVAHWSVGADRYGTPDEFGMLFFNLLRYENIDIAHIDDVVIASVAPSVMYYLEHAIRKYFKRDPIVVGPGVKTGINIKYENPKEVGADKIANAVAALELYGGPAIIVDFGTATTFCAVSSKSEYLGGVICPGIKVSAEALFQRAAKLPRVELIRPQSTIGKNIITSMQSGIVYGYVGQVDYIVKKIKQEMKSDNIRVVATGGLASLIARESETIEKVNNLLALEGLRIIYNRNR